MIRSISTIWLLSSLLGALYGAPVSAHGGSHDNLERAREAERQHHFPRAEHHLDSAIDDNPRDARAWLQLASLAAVRGDIDRAREACAAVAGYFGPVSGLACRGRIALAGGADQRQALRSLLAALEHPTVVSSNDRLTRWASGVAAELAVRLEEHSIAEEHFIRALDGPSAVHLQAAYLDFLLAQGRSSEVLERVNSAEDELAIKLRRVMALLNLEQRDAAQVPMAELHQTFTAWMQAGDYTHGREMAMFYISVMPRPELARQAAIRNLEVQREAEDWALITATAPAEPEAGGSAHDHES